MKLVFKKFDLIITYVNTLYYNFIIYVNNSYYSLINNPNLIKETLQDPVDTGRKLNVHKTFRRCPGRLLNVLCTFNLRTVSTGEVAVCCCTLE